MSYNPVPPRVWSRVQNQCTYTDASNNSDINYNQVYVPLTGQTVTQAQANYEDKLIYKGNILQYKGNSSRLTKSQKYAKLAKGLGTKTFATQSQTYTNPNTTGLQRINYQTYVYPNQIVGAPNNISGPFQCNIQNPNGCAGVAIQDGGTLKCGTYANPCTGDIIKQCTYPSTISNPSSASDVPGNSILCWNNKVQTWFPKSRYTMNNSTDKWPQGYKGLVSAIQPTAPIPLVSLSFINSNYITISWSAPVCKLYPILKFNIYIDDIFYTNILIYTGVLYSYNIYYQQQTKHLKDTYQINNITNVNDKYLATSQIQSNAISTVKNTHINKRAFSIHMTSVTGTSVTGTIESLKSNIIYFDPSNYTFDNNNNNQQSEICVCDYYNNLIKDNSIIQVNTYLSNFIETINENTNTYINLDTYNSINIALNNLKMSIDSSSCFYNIINTYMSIWKILEVSFNKKQELFNLEQSSETWKQDSIILNNIKLLKEYMRELEQRTIFTEINVTTIPVLIKPQYSIYHELYGVPNNLHYDPLLLNNIINSL